MPLLLAFIAVPLVEIALFIQVGGAIGLWPTLLIVVVTAIIGSTLVRSQGSRELAKLRGSFKELRDPTEPLAHGAMIIFSGALLLTPGFFTDFIGFLLLLPPVRDGILKKVRERMNVQTFEMGQGPNHSNPSEPRGPQDRVIDADFEDVTDTEDNPKGPSGWTQP